MLKFKVPDMSCGHCVKSIETAIKSLDPKAQVSCDLARKEVTVESAIAPEHIAAALTEAGYDSQRLAG
ncbi:MAG: heavy-metal-associated domain-containing protein [Methylovirgula sp.]|jgi:copper chaperone